MEKIDDWKDGLGALVFILSLPIFATLYCVALVIKDYIVEFVKSIIK